MSAKELVVHGVTAARVVAVQCAKPVLSCVVIPGNPGAAGFYHAFVEALFKASEKPVNVFAVSHAGHANPPEAFCFEDTKKNGGELERERDWFNLAEQVEHHVAVVKQLVGKDERLVLIGHSLGSYLITRMLAHLQEYELVKVMHLFPALAHLSDTPNGRRISPVFRRYQWIIQWIFALISFLPTSLLNYALQWNFSSTPASHRAEMIMATKQMFSARSVRNCVSLANEEMRTICEFNLAVLQEYNSKMSYLCASDDGWFPLHQLEELQEKVADLDVKVVSTIKHAFVLEKSDEVALFVWEKLKPMIE